MLKLALGFILATSVAANAQLGTTDVPQFINPPGPLQFHFYGGSQTLMATVSADGAVAINWPLVERVAKENNPAEQMTFYARLFLAIRDKTYKDLAQ